jgi:hypothetical protein
MKVFDWILLIIAGPMFLMRVAALLVVAGSSYSQELKNIVIPKIFKDAFFPFAALMLIVYRLWG